MLMNVIISLVQIPGEVRGESSPDSASFNYNFNYGKNKMSICLFVSDIGICRFDNVKSEGEILYSNGYQPGDA